MLRRQGYRIGRNRVHRIYKGLGLRLLWKKRKKRQCHLRLVPPPAVLPNDKWHVDFISDGLRCGKRVRAFNVVDAATRRCLESYADTSIRSDKVIAALERAAEFAGGYPRYITLDNGPEFTCFKFEDWADLRGIKLDFITPGKPKENGIVESFHGKIRDEFLNTSTFFTLEEMRQELKDWVHYYNFERPHYSLKDQTPNEFWLSFQKQLAKEVTAMA